jgi:DNA-binding NtrC family response regulator
VEGSRILVVDDEQGMVDLLVDLLRVWGYEPTGVGGAREALDAAAHHLFDAALVDISMPDMDGLALLREIKRLDLGVDVVMMTGRPTVGSAVEALRAGAYDYLEKPLNHEELRHLLGRLMERRGLQREVSTLRGRLGEPGAPRELVGISPAVEELRGLIAKMAATDSPVLIEGESGTGKELVAAAIHRASARSHGPYIPVNCGAIPAELMESQFFGHVRGAFSGAVSDALGLLRSAHGGVLFLDEVGELPASLQVKLLRVLQDGEVRPVGAVRSQRVDLRVLAATNRNLDEAVRAGAFRQDLFYRLNVVRIHVAPLRERREDIPVLVHHFLRLLNDRLGRAVKKVAPDALAALSAYALPGNVRELENILERAYALGAREEITLADLPPLGGPKDAGPGGAPIPTLVEAERDLIARALRHYGGDKDQVARALGLSRRTLYRRLKEYRLL